jgi:hypothetical protein
MCAWILLAITISEVSSGARCAIVPVVLLFGVLFCIYIRHAYTPT